MGKTDKIKEKKIIMLVSGVAYLIFCLYWIHVNIVMQEQEIGIMEALGKGLNDFLKRPFAIFPIPGIAILQILGITACAGLFIWIEVMNAAERKHYDDVKVLGDAHFMTKQELLEMNRKLNEPFGSTKVSGDNNIILAKDVYISLDWARIKRNENRTVVGGSGAGKTFGFIGPNLLMANTCYVVSDPSSETMLRYGGFFEHIGYKVKCLNLSHMDRSNHYNPFNYIYSDKDIMTLVNNIISNTTPTGSHSSEPFWEKAETTLLCALIGYLHHYRSKEDQNFASVMLLIRACEVDENSGSDKSNTLDRLFKEVRREDPYGFAVVQYDNFKLAAGKTLKSILISAAVRLQAFDIEQVAELTSDDDIALDRIGDERTVLFISLPTGGGAYSFIAAMFYTQLFERLYDYCENTAVYNQLLVGQNGKVIKSFRSTSSESSKKTFQKAIEYLERLKNASIKKNRMTGLYEIITKTGHETAGAYGTLELAETSLKNMSGGRIVAQSEFYEKPERLPIHVQFLIDEFANIGKIAGPGGSEFDQVVSTCRKYDISVTIIIQSLQQIMNMYKDSWETLTGNCDVTIYLGGGADTTTAEWISRLIGKETRVVRSSTFNGRIGGNTSYNRQGVDLLTISQIRELPEDEAIIFLKSLPPIRAKKCTAAEHKNWDLACSIGQYRFNRTKAMKAYEEECVINMAVDGEVAMRADHGNAVKDKKEMMERVASRNLIAKIKSLNIKENNDATGYKKIDPITDFAQEGEEQETTINDALGKMGINEKNVEQSGLFFSVDERENDAFEDLSFGFAEKTLRRA